MRTKRLATVGLTLWSALACAEILGEVCNEDGKDICADTTAYGVQPGGDDGSSIGLEAPQPCSVPAALRCNGSEFQKCVQSPGGLGWLTLDVCGSVALCSAAGGVAGCVPPACKGGDMKCVGASLQLCNETQTGYAELTLCESAGHCDVGGRACRLAPCEAGVLRCNGPELQRCRADQLDWELVPGGNCGTQELCEAARARDAALGSAPGSVCPEPVCEANALRCTGATLERCNGGRTGWAPVQTCSSAALCELGRANTVNSVTAPACPQEPGNKACRGGVCGNCSANRCTASGQFIACVGGQAQAPVACADDNQCTADTCTLQGCAFTPTAIACGLLALCIDGECVGLTDDNSGSGSGNSGSGKGGPGRGKGKDDPSPVPAAPPAPDPPR